MRAMAQVGPGCTTDARYWEYMRRKRNRRQDAEDVFAWPRRYPQGSTTPDCSKGDPTAMAPLRASDRNRPPAADNMNRMCAAISCSIIVIAGHGSIALSETQPEKATLQSYFWPQKDYYENVLYICKGSAQHTSLCWGRKPLSQKPFRFVLDMPKGFELVPPQSPRPERGGKYYPLSLSSSNVERAGSPYVRYVMKFQGPIIRESPDQATMVDMFAVLIKASESTPNKCVFYYHLEDDQSSEPERSMQVVVLPALRGTQPKTIGIHMYSWLGQLLPADEAQTMARTWQMAGINGGDVSAVSIEACRQMNLKRSINFWWFWWPDSEYAKLHPEERVVGFDGKPIASAVMTICPEAFLRPDSEALSKFLDDFKREVKKGQIEWLVWDLEGPNVWSLCFCERCMKNFQETANIAGKLTQEIIKKQYPGQWIDFCTAQSARVAERIKDAMHQGNPKSRFLVYAGPAFDGKPNEHIRAAARANWPQLAKVIDAACYAWYDPTMLRYGDYAAWTAQMIRGASTLPLGVAIWTGPVRFEHNIPLADPDMLTVQMLQLACHGFHDNIRLWYDEPCDGRFYHPGLFTNSMISSVAQPRSVA